MKNNSSFNLYQLDKDLFDFDKQTESDVDSRS